MNDTQIEATVIAAHSLIKGELHLSGPTVVCGRVEGMIVAEDALEIAAEGMVEGDIHGVVVDVQGTVKGNVIASQACRLGPTARVVGELRAANLAIAEGACFVGQVYVGGAEREEAAETPARQQVINRMESLANEAESVAEMAAAAAAPAEPAVRVMTQTVQQTVQQRAPKIIKAR